jgi:hypothetical protein
MKSLLVRVLDNIETVFLLTILVILMAVVANTLVGLGDYNSSDLHRVNRHTVK